MAPVPKVSIIVPNYNHSKFLRERLESIFNQTYQDFEVLLLDDCSDDDSIEILKSYASHPKVSGLVINDKNSGSPFKQWQRGIELAKGDYVWIAESDDVSELNFMEVMLEYLSNGFDLAYCRSKKIDSDGHVLSEGYFWADGLDAHKWKADFEAKGIDEIKNSFLYRNVLPNASSCIFKRTIVSGIESITHFKYAGDWLFWITIFQNARIKYVARPLNRFRAHSNSSRAEKSGKEELSRFREYFAVIKEALKISKRNSKEELVINFRNYSWIFEDMFLKKELLGFRYFFPEIPFRFLPGYYSFMLKKLNKS